MAYTLKCLIIEPARLDFFRKMPPGTGTNLRAGGVIRKSGSIISHAKMPVCIFPRMANYIKSHNRIWFFFFFLLILLTKKNRPNKVRLSTPLNCLVLVPLTVVWYMVSNLHLLRWGGGHSFFSVRWTNAVSQFSSALRQTVIVVGCWFNEKSIECRQDIYTKKKESTYKRKRGRQRERERERERNTKIE